MDKDPDLQRHSLKHTGSSRAVGAKNWLASQELSPLETLLVLDLLRQNLFSIRLFTKATLIKEHC
jgi:hypothetical protein